MHVELFLLISWLLVLQKSVLPFQSNTGSIFRVQTWPKCPRKFVYNPTHNLETKYLYIKYFVYMKGLSKDSWNMSAVDGFQFVFC